MRPYLVHFAHRWCAMRVPELESIAQLLGVELRIADEEAKALLSMQLRSVIHDPQRRSVTEALERASLIVYLRSDEDAVRLASRLVLVVQIVQLWGHGATWEEALAECACNTEALIAPHNRADRTFRVRVETFGCSYKTADQVSLIQRRLECLALLGKVQLKQADMTVVVYMDHALRSALPTPPRHIYVGRRVATAPGISFADQFKLPDRRFLGPTSLDHQLAMIVANQAHARPGALVLDPFCGTASILVGCAAFGARVLGADLDARYLVGKGEGRTIHANFAQYGLTPPVGLLRADFAEEADCWRRLPFLDAVVCDPPYGVRASSKKLADGAAELLHEDGKGDYVPRRERLDINPLLERLLCFAASRLVLGGRLVFLVPTTTDMRGTAVPEHPALELRAESEQPISSVWCRRLVTMEKVRPCTDGMRVSFHKREASLFDTRKVGKEAPSAAATSRRAARAAARAAARKAHADSQGEGARARGASPAACPSAAAQWWARAGVPAPRLAVAAALLAPCVAALAFGLAARRGAAAR